MSLSRTFFRTLTALGMILTTLIATAPADDKKADDGWIPLFNGKDLTGWKMFPKPNEGAIKELITIKEGDKVMGYDGTLKDGKTVPLWHVKDGMIVGSGPHSHLFSEKDDYTDFEYRVEAKINDKGNSGQYFRAKFATSFPPGYESQINATGADKIKTGSLYPDGRTKLGDFRKDICVMDKAAHGPDEFFTQLVIAEGNHIQIFVNGKKTVDFKDPNNTYMKGHFALQGHDPGTVVTFKKVEYRLLKK